MRTVHVDNDGRGRPGGSMRIGDLAADVDHVLGDATKCLHYCAPTHGGWGVLRTALLVPETYVLFVCPAACGRHSAIAAIEQGLKERVSYLCIEDDEIVLGSYEAEIRKTLPELMAHLTPRPRAFMIVVSCIDDLLGTDYAQMLYDFEAAYGIPFRVARMNPISLNSAMPPARRVQRDMYDFLAPPDRRDGSVCLIGPFCTLSPRSELHRMLQRVGRGPLRHISECMTYDAFQELAAAGLNLVTHPEGLAAAEQLREKLGTPFVFAPVAFSEEAIASRYGTIGDALGTCLEFEEPRRLMRQAAQRTLAVVGKRTIAVDGMATCSPFDLARALCESGLHVSEVFTQQLPAHERPAFDWLARHVPDIVVSSPIHHSRSRLRSCRPTADIAIGFSAGYLSAASVTVPISFDEGLYGCHGTATIHRALEEAVTSAHAQGLEDMVRAYGLVV